MNWLTPDWPAPASVRACVTTREGGVSEAPFDSLNLGDHVDDRPQAVAENRRRLTEHFSIQPAWLQQVHGIAVAHADPAVVATADASWTDTPGIACAAMTADCLPVLFCDRAGRRVAAAHAGWRGLAAGVLEATLDCLGAEPSQVLVWLGPAIGPQAFEVGAENRGPGHGGSAAVLARLRATHLPALLCQRALGLSERARDLDALAAMARDRLCSPCEDASEAI